jgi:hypothetical protein
MGGRSPDMASERYEIAGSGAQISSSMELLDRITLRFRNG